MMESQGGRAERAEVGNEFLILSWFWASKQGRDVLTKFILVDFKWRRAGNNLPLRCCLFCGFGTLVSVIQISNTWSCICNGIKSSKWHLSRGLRILCIYIRLYTVTEGPAYPQSHFQFFFFLLCSPPHLARIPFLTAGSCLPWLWHWSAKPLSSLLFVTIKAPA